MQFKHTSSGLTLLEIMFSLIIASLILLYLIPQQLKTSRDQMVSQTVAEMNQIVLAARNYYQDSYNANPTAVLATLWPQSLSALSTYNYLPPAALCSPWPSSTNDATCGYHVPYTIFPANTSNLYDTTAVGIVASGSNDGGNFWGVSIALPNATIAQAVEQRTPFATLCAPAQLKGGTSTSCTATSNTVTTIAPRPAQWSSTPINYANDGLIQTIGSFKVCNDSAIGENAANVSGSVLACRDSTYSQVVTHYIPMPTTCKSGTTPVVFVYSSRLRPYQDGDTVNQNNASPATGLSAGFGNYYPGITLKTARDDTNTRWILWMRTASDTRNTAIGPRKFHELRADYFTVCAPNDPTDNTKIDVNKWDPSNFIGTNSTSGNDLLWPVQ